MMNKNPNGVSLSDSYPANSILELTLIPNGEVVKGLVYCTDEISNSIVLKKSLNYTTLASEIRVINASCIKTKKIIAAQAPMKKEDSSVGETLEVAIPLPNVTKKSMDEREKRAIMLAQESLKHINQKATPEGQEVFDRLLKACNEVKWNGESIIVLNNIKVDPPYHSANCKLLKSGGVKHEGSLERVKRIVGA